MNYGLTKLVIYSILVYIYIHILLLLLLFLFDGVLSSQPGTWMKFSLITIYGSNVPSKPHVKASMVLTRADHLFIHNYIISLLNIFYWSGRSLES